MWASIILMDQGDFHNMEKNIAAYDYQEARRLADEYEQLTNMRLEYKETIGWLPNAIFVFECFRD